MNISKLGRYKIVPVGNGCYLGVGEFACVYLAEDRESDIRVALKVFNSVTGLDINAVIKEALRTSRFNFHPHIVNIYDAGEIDGFLFIAMEYMEGGNLRDRIGFDIKAQQKTLPLKETVTIVMQIASALDTLHKGGVVHRDVKPENILFTHDGSAKLSDFGIARDLKEGEIFQTIAGTLDYMPSEVAQGKGGRYNADIYSLGCVLYEVLTGFSPYPRTYLNDGYGDPELNLESYKKELENSPPIPRERNPTIPSEIERIILRAIDPNPDRRYQTIREFMRDMDELCYEMEVESTSTELDLERDRYSTTQEDKFAAVENKLMAHLEGAVTEIGEGVEKVKDIEERRVLLRKRDTLQRNKKDLPDFIKLCKEGAFLDMFNPDMKEIFYDAISRSVEMNNFYIGTEHIFISLLEVKKVGNLLKELYNLNLSPEAISDDLNNEVKGVRNNVSSSVTVITPRLNIILKDALKIAGENGLKEVDMRSLLQSVFREGNSLPVQYLREKGADIKRIFNEI